MTPPAGPPPAKKRKLNKTGNSASKKKESRKSSCKQGEDKKKVLKRARDDLQDVTVTFYCSSEVALLDKKDDKFKNDRSDCKQGRRKRRKEDKDKASYHRDHLKHGPKNSSYRGSSLLKIQNLRDLLPLSQFHSVRKRTPFSCKIDHIRNDASLSLPNGHDLEQKVCASADRGTFLAAPISVGAAQRGSFPLASDISERKVAESDTFPVHGDERKSSEKGTPDLNEGDLTVRGKFTKAYVRKKYRAPFCKDESPDLYALHLLADTALKLESDPNFQVQVQKQVQGCNEHAEGNRGKASTSKAASVLQNTLQSDEVSLNGFVSPAVGLLICTSTNEKHNCNQNIMEKVNESILTDINVNSPVDEIHLIKILQSTSLPEHGVIIDKSVGKIDDINLKKDSKCCREQHSVLMSKNSICHDKSPSLPEHGVIIDESAVKIDDIDLKKDSKCFRDQHSVLISKDSICHDKFSSSRCQLEACNTYHGNSQPIVRCTESPQNSEECCSFSSAKRFLCQNLENLPNNMRCPSSFGTNNLINANPSYQVRGIVQNSKQKAIRMVDVAIKVMSSMKVGEDAYAMIGKALDSAIIQQDGVPNSVHSTRNCFNPQNGVLGNSHHDSSCNLAEVAATFHPTVPMSPQNESQIPPKLISSCVATLLMIQASSDGKLPPAEVMEILEQAARGLQPQFSQNLHVYREIEDLLGIIKAQILSLVRAPTSSLD